MENAILTVSLKEYKKGIDELKASLLGLEKTSDEYKTTAEEIRKRQDKLNEVISVGKKDADYATNSMNALKKELKELKTQAGNLDMNSEEFQKLSKRIYEVTDELKKAEAAQNTFSRNVGNYTNSIVNAEGGTASLKKQLKEMQVEMANMLARGVSPTDKAFVELAKNAGALKDAISDASQITREYANDARIFSNVIEGVKGGVAVYGAYTTAMQAFGGESEEVQKNMQKLIGIQTALNSLTEINRILVDDTSIVHRTFVGILDKLGLSKKADIALTKSKTGVEIADKVATEGSTVATKALTVATWAQNTALKALKIGLATLGIGAVMLAIDALMENWDKLTNSIRDCVSWLGKATGLFNVLSTAELKEAQIAQKAAAERRKQNIELSNTASNVIGKYYSLQAAFKACRTEGEKVQWVRTHKSELNALGLAMDNVTDAENIFVKNTDAVVNAIIARAVATKRAEQAAENILKAEQKYQENFNERGQTIFNKQERALVSLAKTGHKVSAQQIKDLGLVEGEYKKVQKTISAGYRTVTIDSYELTETGAKKVYNIAHQQAQKRIALEKQKRDQIVQTEQDGVKKTTQAALDAENAIAQFGIKTAGSVQKTVKEIVEKTTDDINLLEEAAKVLEDNAKLALKGTKAELDATLEAINMREKAELDALAKNKKNKELYESQKTNIELKYEEERIKAKINYYKTDRELELKRISDLKTYEKQRLDISIKNGAQLVGYYATIGAELRRNVTNTFEGMFDNLKPIFDKTSKLYPLWFDQLKEEIENKVQDTGALSEDFYTNLEDNLIKGLTEFQKKVQEVGNDSSQIDTNLLGKLIFGHDVTPNEVGALDAIFMSTIGTDTNGFIAQISNFMDSARKEFEKEETKVSETAHSVVLANIESEQLQGNIETIQEYYQQLYEEAVRYAIDIQRLNEEQTTISDEEKNNRTLEAQRELYEARHNLAESYGNRQIELEYYIDQERIRIEREFADELKSIFNDETLSEEQKNKKIVKARKKLQKDLKKISKEMNQSEKMGWKELVNYGNQFASSIGNLLGEVARYEEEELQRRADNGELNEEEQKKEFERIKKTQVAAATVQMLAGAVGAYMQAVQTYAPPFGPILGGVNAGIAIATGMMQIDQIKKQKWETGGGDNPSAGGSGNASTVDFSSVGVNPLLDENIDMANIQNVNVVSDQNSGGDQRVYILQQDITNSNKQVEVRQKNTTF